MKRAFYNVRYKDKGGQKPDQSPLWETNERFEEKPVRLDDYLYSDEWVDKWNAPPPSMTQDSGKPKGIVPSKPVTRLMNGEKVFDDDDVVRSLRRQDNIVEQVKEKLIGG